MSGCVLFLVDESAAMSTTVALPIGVSDGGAPRKTKLESVATLINSTLNKLAQGHSCDVAVVGYRTDADGKVDVGPRWGGTLAGRDFVPSEELPGGQIAVEHRIRKVPVLGGAPEEQPVDFPVWYQPEPGDKAPQIAAFECCSQLVSAWSGSGVPVVIHLFAGSSSDGNPLKSVQNIQELQLSGGAPLVMQAHLGSSDGVPATLFPANRAYVRGGPMRDLFDRTGVLPDPLLEVLRGSNVTVQANARGMLYNARMVDVSRLISLALTHLEALPEMASEPVTVSARGPEPAEELIQEAGDVLAPAAAEELPHEDAPLEPADDVSLASDEAVPDGSKPTPVGAAFEPLIGSVTPETPALVMFVLDRSLENPSTGDPDNAFTKLRDHLSELVGQITKVGDENIDTGIISYGLDGVGELEVRTELEGGLAGRKFARDHELMDGAVFDNTYVEERPNGIGGLMKIPHCRPVLVEVEPTDAAAAEPAFTELAQIISAWCADHDTSTMPPVVLHLTRGRLEAADVQASADALSSVTTSSGEKVRLYHLVITEDEHANVSYPKDDGGLPDENLKALWRASSPLLCGVQIAEDNPDISGQSRGFVVNEKFTLLLDAIKRANDD